jgi:hypothetical protein
MRFAGPWVKGSLAPPGGRCQRNLCARPIVRYSKEDMDELKQRVAALSGRISHVLMRL